MKTALLIVGHGSRSDDAVKVFEKLVDCITGKSKYDFVKGAHMELAKPGIFETIESLVRHGAGRIIIAPYFLYAGMHIKKDIPEIIKKISGKYPDIEFKFAKPIGYEPVLADIVLRRAEEVLKEA